MASVPAFQNSSVPLTAVQKKVAEIALQGVTVPQPGSRPDFGEDLKFAALNAIGTELWLDTGDIDAASSLWNSHFTALTTNNTLLSKEVTKGIYDDLIKNAVAEIRQLSHGISEKELILDIGVLLNAHHGLRLVEKFHAKVSVELHTDLSHDFDAIIHTAHRLHDICPDYFIVKVPLTPTGVLAVRRLIKESVPVNFTLEFAARQNYLAARIAQPDFVNVFLGRLNAFVADHDLGDPEYIGEKATLSSQAELLELRTAGGCRTRQIAASMRSGEQVLTLAGLDVFTMPTKVAEEFGQMDVAPESIKSGIGADLPIRLHPGIDEREVGLPSLWEVPDALRSAVDDLCQEHLDTFSGGDLAAFLAQKGFSDVFPTWSDSQLESITSDGKIPSLDRWKAELKNGDLGLDALFNAAGLMSFSADQAKMDAQICSVL